MHAAGNTATSARREVGETTRGFGGTDEREGAEYSTVMRRYGTGWNMYWYKAQKSGVILKGGRILGVKLVREIKFGRHGSYI